MPKTTHLVILTYIYTSCAVSLFIAIILSNIGVFGEAVRTSEFAVKWGLYTGLAEFVGFVGIAVKWIFGSERSTDQHPSEINEENVNKEYYVISLIATKVIGTLDHEYEHISPTLVDFSSETKNPTAWYTALDEGHDSIDEIKDQPFYTDYSKESKVWIGFVPKCNGASAIKLVVTDKKNKENREFSGTFYTNRRRVELF